MENNHKDILQIDGINCKGFGTIAKAVMQDRRIPTTAKSIYAYFCSYAGNGNIAFPGRDKIYYDLNITKDTFNINFRYLVAYGYIQHYQRTTQKGTYSSNVYKIINVPVERKDLIHEIAQKKIKLQLKNKSYCKKDTPYPKNPDTDKPPPDNPPPDFYTPNINSTNINNLNINKQQQYGQKNPVVVENKYIKNISDKFTNLLGRVPTPNDISNMNIVFENSVAKDIDFDIREKIIIQTMEQITLLFKDSNPDGKINSFKYFTVPIVNEFIKHSNKKGTTKNEPTSTIDFDNIPTNRSM